MLNFDLFIYSLNYLINFNTASVFVYHSKLPGELI